MPKATANGIELEWEAVGDASAEPLLLVMGLGAQLIHWDEAFCQGLAERGFRVIRFDNRDVGLSSWLDHEPVPSIPELLLAAASGQPPEVPYLLSDMACDTAGLLDALEIESAHVVGASMGGMIGQSLAIEHPERVRSLTSIMSTTGDPGVPPAAPAAMEVLLTPPPAEREAAIDYAVQVAKVIGSPGFPFEEQRLRRRAADAWDRAFHPAGTGRQLAAALASGSRKPALAGVTAPTLVIHGDSDPLVPFAGGVDTAEAIPGAELLTLEGMGHDLPMPLWERIQEAIAANARRAG